MESSNSSEEQGGAGDEAAAAATSIRTVLEIPENSADPDHCYFSDAVQVIDGGQQRSNEIVISSDRVAQLDDVLSDRCIEYMFSDVEMDIMDIVEILKHPDRDRVSTLPPVRPKGGSVYVYKVDSSTQKRNVRCDQYAWFDQGTSPIPSKNKLLKRYYFAAKLSDGTKSDTFKKFEHILYSHFGRIERRKPQELRFPCFVIVHYLGDERVSTPLAHGNCRKRFEPFVRTLPSVRETIEKHYLEKSPAAVFSEIRQSALHRAAAANVVVTPLAPRSAAQVHEIQKNLRRKNIKREKEIEEYQTRMDDANSAKETAEQLPGFLIKHSIQSDSDCTFVSLSMPQMLTDFNRVLQLDSKTYADRMPLCVYFDRHVQFGQSHLFILSFRHPLFEDDPLIPVAFLLCQGNYEKCYFEFLKSIGEKCEEIYEAPFAFITDQRLNFILDDELFARASKFLPWNCIEKEIVDWVNTNAERRRTCDASELVAELFRILSTKTKSKALSELETCKTKWTTAFLQFFEYQLAHVIDMSGRWTTEALNMYDPFLGVKMPFSSYYEDFFTKLESWPDVTINGLVVCLYNFHRFFVFHMEAAMSGRSDEFKLKKKYMCYKNSLKKSADFDVLKPAEIVEVVQDSLSGSVEVVYADDFASTSYTTPPSKKSRK